MAQLSDDCFRTGDALMPADDALAELRRRLAPVVGTESVALADASGRILAADVVAARDVPPHDNSAVDGFAVRFDDLSPDGETRLPVGERVVAGDARRLAPAPGTAVRIFTGAPMPEGPDTVLMQEDCRLECDKCDKVEVVIPAGIRRGANRRRRGEDVRAGETVLRAGRRLRPQEVGLAASLGAAALTVYRRLHVGVFSTGDEVHEPGGAVPAGGIYDANRYAIMALLADLGCAVADYGILPDDAGALRAALERAAGECDAVVTSAGMSVGEEDHMSAAVAALGSLHFWKLAIKPGRPVALGQVRGVPFIGLPGNPAAMMVTFLRIARPALLRLAGAADIDPQLYRVRADFEHRKKPARREYLRVRVAAEADGSLVAHKFPRAGAGILTSMVEADGLVELPEEMTQLTPGTMVSYLPFTEVAR